MKKSVLISYNSWTDAYNACQKMIQEGHEIISINGSDGKALIIYNENAGRKCENCVHEDSLACDEPCKSCVDNDGYPGFEMKL